LLQLFLSRLPVELITATTAEQALHLFKSDLIDIVMLDLYIPPGMDGYEAASHMRRFEVESKREPSTIIALTANSDPGLEDKIIQAGFNSVIDKSTGPDPIISFLSRILDGKQA